MVFLYLFLGLACVYDYGERRIPNILLMSMFGMGILVSYINDSWVGVFRYFLSFLVTIFAFSIFFRTGMIGGGDVKLLGIACGYFELNALRFIFYALIFSALFALIKMLVFHKVGERFGYLKDYVVRTAGCLRSGGSFNKSGLYISGREEKIRNGIAMSGPILISALLQGGGFY